MASITPAERAKYAEIFQARGQVNGYMSGEFRFLALLMQRTDYCSQALLPETCY